MLKEVIDSCNEVIEVFKRAAEGHLQIDLKNGQVLNRAGLPNFHYSKNMIRWSKTQTDHPILSALYIIAYYTTHLPTAQKVCSYTYKLLRSK